MSDAQIASQLFDRLIVEYIADHAHALANVEVLRAIALGRDDAGRLLATML